MLMLPGGIYLPPSISVIFRNHAREFLYNSAATLYSFPVSIFAFRLIFRKTGL